MVFPEQSNPDDTFTDVLSKTDSGSVLYMADKEHAKELISYMLETFVPQSIRGETH